MPTIAREDQSLSKVSWSSSARRFQFKYGGALTRSTCSIPCRIAIVNLVVREKVR